MLSRTGPQREAGLARLHDLLLRIARGELQRRSGQLRITGPELDDLDWERLPGRLGADPAKETERRELAGAVRHAVDENLTPRQRKVFVAIVLNGVPLDALVAELGSTRNAIYKTMFDARRKLRATRRSRCHGRWRGSFLPARPASA